MFKEHCLDAFINIRKSDKAKFGRIVQWRYGELSQNKNKNKKKLNKKKKQTNKKKHEIFD